MAYIEPRKNKKGEIIAYRIRVNKGYDANGKKLKPYEMTFKPNPDRSDRQNMKELNETVVEFEKRCKIGIVGDSRQTFQSYAEYAMRQKERMGLKHTTLVRYMGMLKVINAEIGHMRLTDIRPQHLNNFYESLERCGVRKTAERATPIVDFKAYLKSKKVTQENLHQQSGVGMMTIRSALNGENILLEKAQKLCETLGVPFREIFMMVRDKGALSSKTICEYHRLISSIFALADKEMLIPFNPASKATPPKSKRPKVNYFEYEDIERIIQSLETEPLKWRTIVNLFVITGARRGEIMGLKWDAVDWEKSRIHIHLNLLYTSDRGIYEDTTKTEESERYITMPQETMQLLREYRKWYITTSTAYGSRWHNTGFLFFQERSGYEGMPMNPDSVNIWLRSFSKRHELGHINPHAFRHTMASLLLHGNMDIAAISRRLGHAKITTTLDIYSHIMKESDNESAETIADIVLRKQMA